MRFCNPLIASRRTSFSSRLSTRRRSLMPSLTSRFRSRRSSSYADAISTLPPLIKLPSLRLPHHLVIRTTPGVGAAYGGGSAGTPRRIPAAVDRSRMPGVIGIDWPAAPRRYAPRRNSPLPKEPPACPASAAPVRRCPSQTGSLNFRSAASSRLSVMPSRTADLKSGVFAAVFAASQISLASGCFASQ